MNNKEIPNGWALSKLKDITQIISGGTPARDIQNFWEGGTIKWVTPTDITNSSSRILMSTKDQITKEGFNNCSAKLLPPGTLLMTSRATLGEIKVAGKEMCTNQGFKSLVPSKHIDNWFLYYQMILNKERYASFGIGSTFLEVNTKDTEKFDILHPPLHEQRKIAKILTTVDNLIEKTETLIAKYQSIKQGMMHDLFTRGVYANGQLRPPVDEAPELYKESELGWIPREWETGSIINYVDTNDKNSIKPGPFGSSLKKECYTEKGYKIYGQEQVIKGDSTFGDYYISKEKYFELFSFRVKPNDVLISLVGTVGKVLILPHDCDDGIINPRLIKISPDLRKNCPIFLAHLLMSEIISIQLEKLSHGLTMEVLSATTLRKVCFPIPVFEEQNRISNVINAINLMILKEQTILNKYRKTKQALMQDLLTGKVRVNPDKPEDTPS